MSCVIESTRWIWQAALLACALGCTRPVADPPPQSHGVEGGSTQGKPLSPAAEWRAPSPESAPSSASSPAGGTRLFFSGHSLLDNPTPEFVELIARSGGADVEWNQQNVLGSPIRVRTRGNGSSGWQGYRLGKNREGQGMDVVRELRTGSTLRSKAPYDVLVIVERNDLLDTILWENTAGFLLHYHDRLIEGNRRGRTLFHQVWPAIDKGDPRSWLQHVRLELQAMECVTAKNNLLLQRAGREDRVEVSPGGVALAEVVEAVLGGKVPGITGTPRARLDALFSDDVHLTRSGSYAMAAVIYGAVFRKSPVGAAYPTEDMSQGTAEALQRLAWAAVTSHRRLEGAGESIMEACRAHFAERFCPSSRTLQGRPEGIPNCGPEWSNPDWSKNVFRWPDPSFEPLPAP